MSIDQTVDKAIADILSITKQTIEEADTWGDSFIAGRMAKIAAEAERIREEHMQWKIAEYRRLGYTELDQFNTTKEEFEKFEHEVENQRSRLCILLLANHPEWIDSASAIVTAPYSSPCHLRKMHKTKFEKLLEDMENVKIN